MLQHTNHTWLSYIAAFLSKIQIYLTAKDPSEIGATGQLHDKVGNLLNGPLRQ